MPPNGNMSTNKSQKLKKDPCPLLVALERLQGKWTLLVLSRLLDQSLHFSELHSKIPRISGKSLVRVLARLEKQGMVERKVISTRPFRVTYSLARKDPLLRKVIEVLSAWGSEISLRR